MDKNKSFIYRLDLNRFDTWYLDLLEQTLLSQAHLYKPRDIIQKIMKNKFIFNRWLNRKLFRRITLTVPYRFFMSRGFQLKQVSSDKLKGLDQLGIV